MNTNQTLQNVIKIPYKNLKNVLENLCVIFIVINLYLYIMATLTKGIISILKSIEKPYFEYNIPENMTEYTQIIEDGYYIYGTPHITDDNVSPFCPDDVLLVALDENGEQLALKFPYYITPFGDKYRLNKKNEKIWKSKNECKQYGLTLADGSPQLFRPHHLQLWSYYSNLNWKEFCKNKDKNYENSNGDAEVDHILQGHKRCHFKFLEAVPHNENTRRSKMSSKGKNASKQSGITKGKPFHIWIDGIKIVDENNIDKVFENTAIGIQYLKQEYRITISERSIGRYIKRKGVFESSNNHKIQFAYTEEYKETLKDLPGEKWHKPNEWKQKGEIEKIYTDHSGIPPKAISNLGRILNGIGKRILGTQCKDKKGNLKTNSVFNGVSVHKLVWLAFSDELISGLDILHNKEDDSNEKDENGNCIRYSNAFNTLRLGTHGDNMIEMGEDRQREKERDPNNEFIVKDPNGVEIMRSHYVPDCFRRLYEAYPNETFNESNIRGCLNPNLCNKTHNDFTFSYVIPRPVSTL